MAQYKEKINEALKEAMKSKDNPLRDTIRLLQAAFKQVEVDTRKDLTEDGEMDILLKEAKKRRESIEELAKAGRDTGEEVYELGVIESFLPKQMSEDEIRELVKAAIAETGATTQKDMGKVMGKLNPQTKGKADGKLVSQIVKEALGG
jgi:uncharacterized protein YqeY